MPDDRLEPAAEAATIENLLREERTFPPPAAFARSATTPTRIRTAGQKKPR